MTDKTAQDGRYLAAAREQGAMIERLARAAAPLKFFLRDLDVQVRFTTDEAGKVTGAVMAQSGEEQTGRRLDP